MQFALLPVLGRGEAVQREGEVKQDFLLQRLYLKALGFDGDMHLAANIGDSLPLDKAPSKGKSAWVLYGAAKDFCIFLQDEGHGSIALQHFAFDRAVLGSVSKKLFQKLAPKSSTMSAGCHSADILRDLYTWPLATGCCPHHVYNAFKWGVS
eukprot:1522012-Amphidinium_carterae.1